MTQINNLHVSAFEAIESPKEVMSKVPITQKATDTVFKGRQDLQNIFDGKDPRKVVIVGPCSIHNMDQALEYADKLNELRLKVEDKMHIIMRAYFEKPRTTVGWKGFIYDPYLDNSYTLAKGVELARELLIKINDMGLPTATEVLGPITIQYYSDLICWAAIGARTAESQTHRELASGLSMPVGFKNGTLGNVDIALNAIITANNKHQFLGMDEQGKVSIVKTTGNQYCHIVLRGGKNGPNYESEHVKNLEKTCSEADMKAQFLIDCSHANSNKDYRNQAKVWESAWQQIQEGSSSIYGLMMESNLCEGNQKLSKDLKHGVSITDSCIGWETTEELIMGTYQSLK
jgi:3-deoxy-7-phosphoheptulonate synthase